MKEITKITLLVVLVLIAIGINFKVTRCRARTKIFNKNVSSMQVIKLSNNIEIPISVVDRVLDHFDRHYRAVADPTWLVMKEDIIAKFTLQDIAYSVNYDMKGAWKYTVENYQAHMLPERVKILFGNKFDGFSVLRTRRLHSADNPKEIYMVQLLKGKQYKEIEIKDCTIREVKDMVVP